MKYNKSQYEEMAKKFNAMGFKGKVLTIRNTPQVFKLEEDNGWYMLRLVDETAMENEWDMLFEFDNEVGASSSNIRDLFSLLDIKLH